MLAVSVEPHRDWWNTNPAGALVCCAVSRARSDSGRVMVSEQYWQRARQGHEGCVSHSRIKSAHCHGGFKKDMTGSDNRDSGDEQQEFSEVPSP
jgi:hypothetical protein